MKRFAAVALAALMLLSVFAASASAAAIADTVEVRSQVLEGSSYTAILSGGPITIDATSFAGFYYDIDDDVKTEEMIFTYTTTGDSPSDADTIGEKDLTYIIKPQSVDYEFTGFGSFNVSGFFAEEFVPVFEEDEDPKNEVFAKLILDSDDDYTLRTGESLELGAGYSLEAKQVDVDGKKAWLTFSKDGEFVEDKVITIPDNGEADVWNVTLDVADVSDVVVARVQLDEVFQGAVDSIVQIEGLWLIDYENAIEIDTGDEFGVFEVDSINETTIILNNKDDDISLESDSEEELYAGLSIVVADPAASDPSQLRFYLSKEFEEPGTYEIRGSVYDAITSPAMISWTPKEFAGFYYDADDNVSTETLSFSNIDVAGREIAEDNLTYTITPGSVDYEFGAFGNFSVAGFFAEDFVPVFEEDEAPKNEVLAKLILDSDDDYTLRTGESLELGAGYSLEAKQVDVDGKKAWLTFSKDGEFVEDKVITIPDNGEADVWNVTLDVADVSDAVVARVKIDEVFQGAVDSIVQIEGLWLIDYENAVEIDTGDEFGIFEVDSISTARIVLINKDDDVNLDKDSVEDLYGNLKFRIADNDTLRFYPFAEETIGGEPTPVPDKDDKDDVVPPVNDTTVDNDTTDVPPVEDDTTGDDDAAAGDDDAAAGDDDAAAGDEDDQGIPGFGIVLGLAGLLAVVYLVRRN